MLSHYPGDKSVKTKKERVMNQRKVKLFVFTFFTAVILAVLLNFTINFIREKQAEDIIVSAQEEANQILSEAKNDASIVKQNAKKDAHEQATNITEAAKIEAENITESAEVKADEIIDKAINTEIDEVQTLLAITEAEAGGQSIKGKAAVAATIKNRVKSDEFDADSIKEVVYSPGQFDPVSNGKIKSVKPSPSTFEGVKLCLQGKDYSNGALYFYNPSASGNESKKWFNTLQTTAIIDDHVFKK
ncbi:MAG: cell wall hydrolase [Clostridia bacterium]|jgi:N-acetylmuramoyl-L-alanine amidase|nr:cell wall hydrolase [Clostridia bacterium]